MSVVQNFAMLLQVVLVTCVTVLMFHLHPGAIHDLDQAITLTDGLGRTASLAFTQRGLLMKLNGSDAAAESDFTKAAKLGNKFAQQEVEKYFILKLCCHFKIMRCHNTLKNLAIMFVRCHRGGTFSHIHHANRPRSYVLAKPLCRIVVEFT